MATRLSGRLALAAMLIAGGACSGATSPKGTSATSRTTATSATATTSRNSSQAVTVTPARALREGQVVRVEARGYTPNEVGLGVVECGSKGGATGASDCDIAHLKVVNADASGVVTTDFPVTAGPFGGNAIVCSARLQCLVSVTQLNLTPAEAAAAPISFG